MQLTALGFTAGIWEARLDGGGGAPPDVEVSHRGAPLTGLDCRPLGSGAWLLRVPVPAETLGDGVQTFLVTERPGGTRLGSFAILAGAVLEDDIHAEIALLRAEIEMLKKALRRLAAGPAG